MKFQPDQIYWQAHRGGGRAEAPDNTLFAMEYGWSLGGIPEADIRITADQEIVCLHDNTLARTTDAPPEFANRPIRELTLAQLKPYDAGRKFRPDCAGQRIPALRDVFELMRQDRTRMLYADIKNYDTEMFPVLMRQFAALTAEYQVAEQIVVAGCDYPLNCRFKDEIPGITTMQWIGYWGELDPAREKMKQFRELADLDFAKLDLVQLHLRFQSAPDGEWNFDLTPADLQYALGWLGSRLQVFPLGAFTETSIHDLLRLGIRQFATDEPRRFRHTLLQFENHSHR